MRRLASLAAIALCGAAAVGGCTPRAYVSETCAKQIGHLQKGDRHLRRMAARELAKYPEAAPETVPLLVEALKDEDLHVRTFAAGSLIRLTGRDFGRRHGDWKAWYRKHRDEIRTAPVETLVDGVRKSRAELAYTKGQSALGAAAYRQAASFFNDAVSNDPTDPRFHNGLGVALLRMGHYADALEKFHDALAREPKLASAHMNVGEVHRQRARDYAIVTGTYLERAREAIAYSREEEAEKAAREAKKAAELRLKSLGAAVEAYDVAISVEDPKRPNWNPRLGKGRALFDLRRFDEAIAALHEARSIDASVPDIYSAMALVYYARDQYHLAWKAYQEVRRLGCDMQPEFVQRLKEQIEVAGGTDEP